MRVRQNGLIGEDGRVAVIGAGAAGIAAVIALREAGLKNITVFEGTDRVGGTWVYTPKTKDAHSSMYKSLHCNIPKNSMCFGRRQFDSHVPDFPAHTNVAKYLQSVADEHDVESCVRFNSPVARIAPVDPDDFATGWTVQTYVTPESRVAAAQGNSNENDFIVDNMQSFVPDTRPQFGSGETHVETLRENRGSSSPVTVLADPQVPASPALSSPEYFDAVVLCNGHFTVPNDWRPEGADRFPGEITHSHTYRTPERFNGKKVVVLGAGPSGTDIALELHRNGATVTLSHKKGGGKDKYGGLVPQTAAIKRVYANGDVEMEDGAIVEAVDEILLCTGYAYSFPFLSDDSGMTVTKDRRAIHGLLMHCVVGAHPTLSVIGMVYKVIPFPVFEDQAAFIAGVLRGTVPFDVSEDRIKKLMAEEDARRDPNAPEKYLHALDDSQWEYRRTLAEWTGRPLPTETLKEIYNDSRAARMHDPLRYRQRVYKILGSGPGQWRVFMNGKDVTGRVDPDVPGQDNDCIA